MSYSLDNLKNIEFAPNVEYDIPTDLLTEEANEISSRYLRSKDKENEFYDEKN